MTMTLNIIKQCVTQNTSPIKNLLDKEEIDEGVHDASAYF